jgi:uncharacterized protein
MRAVFADTSYYLALLNKGDEYHAAAYKFTAGYDGAFVTTAWVLAELANALCRAANRPLFLSLLEDLQEDNRVTIVPSSKELFHQGIELYRKRIDKDWSLTDCISFVVMQEGALTDSLTADHHFKQAGFHALLR